jgi:hypothetical protein
MTAGDPLQVALELPGPDPSSLEWQYERSLLQVLIWLDDDGSLTRTVADLVLPEDFGLRELGELFRWHRRWVARYGVPDPAGLVHRLHQTAAERPAERAKYEGLAREVVELQGRPEGLVVRALHYAHQVRLSSVLRQLLELQRSREVALALADRTPEALLQAVTMHRDLEDALLARVTP